MPFPSGQFSRIVFDGPVSSQDTWSTGVWWNSTSGRIPADGTAQAVCDALATTFDSMFWSAATNPWKALCVAATKLARATLYVYDDGVLTQQAVHSFSPIAGTAVSAVPAYCASVFSLRTAGFGRSARGRMYLPHTGTGMDAATLQWTVVQQYATNLATWLSQEFIQPNLAMSPIVLSQTHGTWLPVTRVLLDTIPDTQHGRSDKATPNSVFTATVS